MKHMVFQSHWQDFKCAPPKLNVPHEFPFKERKKRKKTAEFEAHFRARIFFFQTSLKQKSLQHIQHGNILIYSVSK